MMTRDEVLAKLIGLCNQAEASRARNERYIESGHFPASVSVQHDFARRHWTGERDAYIRAIGLVEHIRAEL